MEMGPPKSRLNPAEGKPKATEQEKAKPAGNKDRLKVFIATVDLGRLPPGKSWVKAQRKKGRLQYLYVLGQVPVGFGPVVEEDGDD